MLLYLLDSNIFDYILQASIPIETIKQKGNVYITNVQLSEIKNTPDINKRNSLLDIIEKLNPNILSLESGIWLDSSYWDDSEIWNENIGNVFIEILGSREEYADALIGEVAKVNKLILVTNDKRFAQRASKVGIEVISAEDFFNN